MRWVVHLQSIVVDAEDQWDAENQAFEEYMEQVKRGKAEILVEDSEEFE